MSPRPGILEGWKEIARAIEVDEKTARAYMNRTIDPLPVRRGHLGWYAHASAIEAWVLRQDRSGQDVVQLRRLQARLAELEEQRPSVPVFSRRPRRSAAKDA